MTDSFSASLERVVMSGDDQSVGSYWIYLQHRTLLDAMK